MIRPFKSIFKKYQIFLPEYVFHSSMSSSFSTLCMKDSSVLSAANQNYYDFSPDFPSDLQADFSKVFSVHPDFISEIEEESLLQEIQPIMKRMRYEFDHWDNAIQGFREIERSNWNEKNSDILSKVKRIAFHPGISCLTYAHVLDLDEKGHIKPHIDSARFCGDIIAGLNLLSDAVMRLQKEKSYYCDILLKRKSLYIMSGTARYEFTHEVLPNESSIFKGTQVLKKRRISLILRSEPNETED